MASTWLTLAIALLSSVLVGLTVVVVVPISVAAPMTVSVDRVSFANTSVSVTLSVTSHRASTLSLTAVSAPGRIVPPAERPIFFVEDPGHPVLFGSAADVVFQLQRIERSLTVFGPPPPISVVSTSDLPSVLATNPRGIVMVLESGVLPTSVLPPNSTYLRAWLYGGGTLVWAGGPIGFFQQADGPSGARILPIGWRAQTQLLGYPLTDPTGNASALLPLGQSGDSTASAPSPYSSALATVYRGVPFGANLSQVFAHGGVDLGWDEPGPHARSSLVYLPEGYGSIFYFGGALSAPGSPGVADGGYSLAIDVARLLGTGFVPSPLGSPAYRHVAVDPFGSSSIRLDRVSPPTPAVLIVQSSVLGDDVFYWSNEISPGGTTP